MNRKVVHTCYGCQFYYRVDLNGEVKFLVPFATRHCDIEDVWKCNRFVNGGKIGVLK